MRKNPLNKGIIIENADGIGTVTPAMVEARARELARINGRDASKPTKADYQQAKRKLTGEAETDPQEESSESVPESERWDPAPGSSGHQAAESPGEDEDAEGRSEAAQMFEEGVSETEHDQMRRASAEQQKRDDETGSRSDHAYTLYTARDSKPHTPAVSLLTHYKTFIFN